MSLSDFLNCNLRRIKRCDKIISRKRLLVLIFGCLLFFYIFPFFFRKLNTPRPNKEDQSFQCIEQFLRVYHTEIEASDSSIWISPFNHPQTVTPTAFSSPQLKINELSKNLFLPFIGNGKFSITPTAEYESERRFHIFGKRILDISIPFDPIVNFDEFGTHVKSAIVSRYLKGTIEKCTCAIYGGGVVSIRETFTAHRLIPSLFTQDIRISNPTDAPLILRFSRKGWLNKPSSNMKEQPIMVTTSDHRHYSIIVSNINENNDKTDSTHFNDKSTHYRNNKAQAVAIAYPSLHSSIEVQPHNHGSLIMQTFVNYTKTYTLVSDLQAAIPDLKVTLREAVKKVVQLSATALQQYHEAAWESLWWSGFSISHSHAPNAVNGYQINATTYYLMSQRPMAFPSKFEHNSHIKPLVELSNLLDVNNTLADTLLHKPESCYDGHSTFHATKLWGHLNSLSDLQNVLRLWFLTLEKQGCENLLRSGAKGVLQATMLSLAGLRFSPKHLELNSHPSDLQRPFLVRRLLYGNNTSLNLSVIITEENKAFLQVSLDQNKGKDFYACDAGCLDAPVRLSANAYDFPVKLTEPLTSLLYVTSDREHVRELKHSIHVKDIGEAPPHEHHTIAMHRYGHSLGGLPTFFWIAIIILIIVFHLFLGKLIYNEYFNANNLPYERLSVHRNIGRYSM